MLRVSDEVKNLFKSDNVHKDLEIRIPEAEIVIHNDDILCESMELQEAIETGNSLSFTGCIASSFKVDTVDIVADIEGMGIEVDIIVDDNIIPIFRGIIDTVTNTTHEEYTTEIMAYDALYRICNTDVASWYNSLSFPITIRDMRNSFFNLFGIEQEIDFLPNDPMTVNKTIDDSVIEGAKIIKPLCQINGRFGRISRAGTFEYVHLVEGTEAIYPAEDLFPADDLYPHDENAVDNVSKAHYTSIKFENYDVDPITMVQLIGKEGNVIATSGERAAIQNVFTVKDNPLIYGKTGSELSSVAQNLYNTVRGLWYRPADITCIGLPYVECGDFVLMVARRSIIRAYVLTRKLKGVQSLKDDYSAKGTRRQPPYIPSIKQQVAANASAIKAETERASESELTERNRAISAENNLNNSIGSVNNRVSGVYAELVDTKNLVATKASISDLQVTNNLVATKANISDLNSTNARIDNLQARMITANTLSTGVNGVRISNNYVYCTALALGSYVVSQGWAQTRARSGTYNVYRNGAVVGTVTIGT